MELVSAENPDVDWTYSGGDPGPFLSEMQQRLSHKVWEQAALLYHGLGAENGVAHMSELVCCTKLPQHKSVTVQGSVSTTPTPKLLVLCAGHLITQCFIRIYDCPCIPTSFELDKTDRIVDEARTKAHSCPIFWFPGLPPRGWYPELPNRR